MKCSGIKGNLEKVKPFDCNMCKPNKIAADFLNENIARDLIENVEIFCYHSDVLSTESEDHKAVTTKIRVGLKRFKGCCRCCARRVGR